MEITREMNMFSRTDNLWKHILKKTGGLHLKMLKIQAKSKPKTSHDLYHLNRRRDIFYTHLNVGTIKILLNATPFILPEYIVEDYKFSIDCLRQLNNAWTIIIWRRINHIAKREILACFYGSLNIFQPFQISI